jgi:hypothetical protein
MLPAYIKSCCEGERGFFIDLRTGELYRLNTVGVCVMQSLNQGIPLEQLPEIISSEFEVSYDQANEDITKFMKLIQKLEELK